MARNSLAGSTKGTSKSARFYQRNPKARAKKKSYDTTYHKQPKARKYRAFLGSLKPAGKGKNNAHYGKGGKTRVTSESSNKANNRPKYRATTAPKKYKKGGKLKSLLKRRKK